MMTGSLARLLLAAACLASTVASSLAGDIVAVTMRTVYPGETIEVGMLQEVELRKPIASREKVATAISDLDGKVAKRTLLPNRLIPISAVRDAWVVERGAQVRLIFVSGPLTISAAGVPLEPGSAGDFVKVRNIDTGAIVNGTVMADGTIRVGAT